MGRYAGIVDKCVKVKALISLLLSMFWQTWSKACMTHIQEYGHSFLQLHWSAGFIREWLDLLRAIHLQGTLRKTKQLWRNYWMWSKTNCMSVYGEVREEQRRDNQTRVSFIESPTSRSAGWWKARDCCNLRACRPSEPRALLQRADRQPPDHSWCYWHRILLWLAGTCVISWCVT